MLLDNFSMNKNVHKYKDTIEFYINGSKNQLPI